NSRSTRSFRLVSAVALALLPGLCQGQNTQPVPLAVSGPVQAAPHGTGGVPYRILPIEAEKQGSGSGKPQAKTNSGNQAKTNLILPPRVFYPTDLVNNFGGSTVVTTQFHPVYVNNVPSHWGDVGTFLTDLGKSDFIHIVDQYVGTKANNRYTL